MEPLPDPDVRRRLPSGTTQHRARRFDRGSRAGDSSGPRGAWSVAPEIASPNGYRSIDAATLAAKTGHAVRHQYKDPDAPDVLPSANAMVVAPITCNSLAKWAAGISDTLPLGLLVEAVGKRQPVVAMPFSNREQINFPAIQEAMNKLTAWGVTVLVGDDIYKQHQPGTGDDYVHLFPWHLAWQALLQHPWLDLNLVKRDGVKGAGPDSKIGW